MERLDFNSSFPQTFWTEVEAAGRATVSESPSVHESESLNRLLAVYRVPLISRLSRRLGLSWSEAEDRYHDFVLDRVLQGQLLRQADRSKGRFRSFLLTAFYRSAVQRWRSEHSQKRSPAEGFSEYDDLALVGSSERADSQLTLDAGWSLATLNAALAATRADCLNGDGAQVWAALEWRLFDREADGRGGGETYHAASSRLGMKKVGTLRNKLTEGQKQLRRQLTEALARASFSPDDAREEWARLKLLLEDPATWRHSEAVKLFREYGHAPVDQSASDATQRGTAYGELIRNLDPAEFLKLVEGEVSRMSNSELKEIWEAIWSGKGYEIDAGTGGPGIPLGDCLENPRTPLEVIEQLRESAKLSSRGLASQFPKEIAQVIYPCCTAFPWVHQLESSSRLTTGEQVKGWQWLRSQVWLPRSTRSYLDRAIRNVPIN